MIGSLLLHAGSTRTLTVHWPVADRPPLDAAGFKLVYQTLLAAPVGHQPHDEGRHH
jgi:hypothetical protein